MYKRRYITDEEKINCQKVADAFAELFQNEDLVVLNAGKYGFVKLQYFKFPFGFDNIDSFYDCKSLFDELWEEWLHTQLINLTANTPMADMDYEDILKCLPEEKREELLDMRLSLAEKTGIEGILEKCKPDLWSDEFMKTTKIWSRDWEHFDWEQVRGKLCGSETGSQEGKAADKPDIGITLDELKEYFEWLYDTQPELYFKVILYMALAKAGVPHEEAQAWANHPKELEDVLKDS
ncbi:MAG: hypothetical protein K2K90_00150 [Lachnospiraceae bacterium]|nr:hypothetical protein [Lachnospiraceae bacterium]